METTLGERIGMLRRQKRMKQDELAERLGVSPQAVSKWENDQTCPDINLLLQLASYLDVTVDELLSGKKELKPVVEVVPDERRKDMNDMMLRIIAETVGGDKARINIPMALVQAAMESGMEMPQINGNAALQGIDWNHVMELIRHGVIGNLVEAESADGDVVRIFVE